MAGTLKFLSIVVAVLGVAIALFAESAHPAYLFGVTLKHGFNLKNKLFAASMDLSSTSQISTHVALCEPRTDVLILMCVNYVRVLMSIADNRGISNEARTLEDMFRFFMSLNSGPGVPDEKRLAERRMNMYMMGHTEVPPAGCVRVAVNAST